MPAKIAEPAKSNFEQRIYFYQITRSQGSLFVHMIYNMFCVAQGVPVNLLQTQLCCYVSFYAFLGLDIK